jgi:hypothetical protein
MQTIIPAPTVRYHIKEMTPRQSNFASQALSLAKETAAFIAFIVFVCAVIAVCVIIH